MESWASFRFFGSLNDFLPASKKEVSFSFSFSGRPAVKDTLEAIGVPHPEIAVILINHQQARLTTNLASGDLVEVYPVDVSQSWPEGYSLWVPIPQPARFVLDVHLGKLARNLRMLGFDALYQNNFTEHNIIRLATDESRVVLTRDVGLLKHKAITWGYWLRSQKPRIQVQEVISYYRLAKQVAPFSRCLECNAGIVPVSKKSVLEQLPPKTRQYFNTFYQCGHCRRVYWKGSHFDHMQDFIAQLAGA